MAPRDTVTPMLASAILGRREAVGLLTGLAGEVVTLTRLGLRLALLGRDTCSFMRPDEAPPRAARGALAALDAALDAALGQDAAAGGAPLWSREPGVDPRNLWDLAQALPHILLNTPPQAVPLAAPPGPEALVLTRGASEATEARLLDLMHADATALRFFTARDGQGRPLLVSVVRDEPARGSLFAALEATGVLGDSTVLRGIGQPPLLFLPATAEVDAGLADAVAILVRAAAALFGLDQTEVAQNRARLAIDAAWQPDLCRWQIQALVPVAAAQLLEGAMLAPQAGSYVQLEVVQPVPDAARAARLRALIRANGVEVGYRLSLQGGLPTTVQAGEVERLAARIIELELELEARRGVAADDVLLLRFGAEHMAELAAVLRRIPGRVLESGAVRHAFTPLIDRHGQERQRHFLLLGAAEAGPVAEILTPFALASRGPATPGGGAPGGAAPGGAAPLSFWIDPLWRQHYGAARRGGAAAGGARLFVPRGCRLEPPVHSWTVGDMDDHLAAAVRLWGGDAAAGQPWPAEPWLVFDPAPPEDPLRLGLQVLDGAAFAPLAERVGWLNDCLVLSASLGPERLEQAMALVASTAAASRRHGVLETVTQAAAARAAALARSSEAAMASSLGDLDETLAVIEGQLDQAVDEIAGHLDRITGVHRALTRIRALADQAEDAHQQSLESLEAVAQSADRLARDHAETLRRLRALHEETERRHDTAVALIEQRLAWLADQVDKVRRLRVFGR